MSCFGGLCACLGGGEQKPSLWVRMGDEAKIRPLCNELYQMHSTDPLTADWFALKGKGNSRSAAEVKENVFTFFSAGIGGPHTYGGNDMKAAHMHMKIDNHAFHALTNHVLVGMEKHKTGGRAEREEVYDILMSLRADVMAGTAEKEVCTASCICGACQVKTVGQPKWVCNCHCSQCRRTLSASYATLAGFDPENIIVVKGQENLVSHTTGKEERLSCKICSGKVYAHLHHLNHKAIYNDMFTTPNHGPDGQIGKGFTPTMHIFYTSGNTNVLDGLPKFNDLPAAFGGSDKKVDEVYHTNPDVTVAVCKATCACGACEVTTKGAPKWVANCHCSQCRRTLSAAYATLAGFDPDSVTVTKGQDKLVSYTTGKEERFSCKICSSKVYAHLHHLNHKAIYNDMFTTPNQGPDGKIGKAFAPSMHIFYTSGNTAVPDGLPKYVDLPAAFGGSDKKVAEPRRGEAPPSLWDRMGGEKQIRPLCNDLYQMHSTDPLTAPWFGAHIDGNRRTADEVKENVFTFFSAGIGGPHEYKGNDMKTAHTHMKIDKHAFHALCNHVFVGMQKHRTGGPGEREEVWGILMSLRPDVMYGTEKKGWW